MSSRLTRNQTELLLCVRKGEGGERIDFDQLLDKLSWSPSKASCQFTIRALIEKGYLVKLPELVLRRGRKRVCYDLTREGLQALDPRPALDHREVVMGLESVSSGSHSGSF